MDEIIIILLLILVNGIFAMSEIAVIQARKTTLSNDEKKGSKGAKTALRLANDPDRFLSTVQIGITLIGILTGIYSGASLSGRFSDVFESFGMPERWAYPLAQGIIVIVVTYLTIIFGELVPKRIGMSVAERVSEIIARPMYVLSVIAGPFVWVLSKSTEAVVDLLGVKNAESKVTEEDIKSIVQEGKEDGEVQEVEQDIVERVFNLGDRNIGSIMTHRSDLVWLNINDTNEEIRKTVHERLYNIYPVADDELDNIVGVVDLKDLFGKVDSPDFNLRQLVRPAQYFPHNQSVYNALEHMKQGHEKYGLVTDEFGSIEGIVTLNDVLTALIGEVAEEGEEPDIIRRDDGSYLVDGQCSFYEFLEYFDMEDLYTDHYYNTLSGLILKILERIPRTGEKLQWNNFHFEIVDMDGARIDKVLVTQDTNERKEP